MQQQAEAECKTPSSLAPCGNNVTVFYYDSERGECLVSGIGGCGHPNTYSTEEECERRCGAFRGIGEENGRLCELLEIEQIMWFFPEPCPLYKIIDLPHTTINSILNTSFYTDVCGARLDPGPCRASIPKIYWDAMTGSCQQFAYGGCGGGSNRFSSVEECMNVCGDTGPGAYLCVLHYRSGSGISLIQIVLLIFFISNILSLKITHKILKLILTKAWVWFNKLPR